MAKRETPKKKILILDDNKIFLEELSEILESCGYETVSADDTQGFMELVKKIKPSVILLDLKMPKKTGYLVAYELKESRETRYIPIIAISGFIKNGETPPAELTNIKACLQKPFSMEDILARIEEVSRKENEPSSLLTKTPPGI